MSVPIRTTGLAFPLELEDGKSILASGAELIQSSLKIILAWPIITRQFNGKFGSRIDEVIENQNDDILIALVNRFVIDAIKTWERRVELKSIEVTRPSITRLSVSISYIIREDNIQDTLYYNFYIN